MFSSFQHYWEILLVFRVSAIGRDGLLENSVFSSFHNRYLQYTDDEFWKICAMYIYPQSIFFNCEKDYHSKLCDVQLGNVPSSSYLKEYHVLR